MPDHYSYRGYLDQLRKDARTTVPDAVKAIRTAVKLTGPRAVQAEIQKITQQPVDRGGYKRSFRFEDIEGGATAYNFALHAPIIEWGRRKGAKAPPLDVITAWVLRKGLSSRSSRSFATDSQWRAARQIAFVIARAIKRRGLPAHLVMTRAAETMDLEVKRAIDEMLAGRT